MTLYWHTYSMHSVIRPGRLRLLQFEIEFVCLFVIEENLETEMKENFWPIKQWPEILFHFRTVYITVSWRAPDKEARPSPYHYCSYLTPKPALWSHQHRTLVRLYLSGNIHCAYPPANPTTARQECFELLAQTVKFGYSEKATKFEKIFHLKFDATQ